jgi:hypothetical protein
MSKMWFSLLEKGVERMSGRSEYKTLEELVEKYAGKLRELIKELIFPRPYKPIQKPRSY